MTFDEASTALAKLIFTTSDPGSVKIHNCCNGSPYEETILKEFIYAKAFIAYLICLEASNSNNYNEVSGIMDLVFQKLKVSFERDRFGYGNNYTELKTRFNQYLNNVENYNNVTREFINCIGIENLMYSNLDPFVVVSIMEGTRKWMSEKMDTAQHGQKKGGCYVATATYQNSFHPNVVLLRDYRDRILRKSVFGRVFIVLYYKFGPYLAYFPENFTFIRRLSKNIIDRIVLKIKAKYY